MTTSDFQRERARETLKKQWADPAFRAKVAALNAARSHPSGPDHPRWKGETKTAAGYVYVRRDGGYVQRSHLVWEQAHPDDPIQPGESIHHANHVTDDDRPENLRKLSRSAHSRLHHKGRQWSPEHRAKAKASLTGLAKTYTVKSCGKAHSYCRVCRPELYGPEWRAKVVEGHRRHPVEFTPELRAKLSASATRAHQQRREKA